MHEHGSPPPDPSAFSPPPAAPFPVPEPHHHHAPQAPHAPQAGPGQLDNGIPAPYDPGWQNQAGQQYQAQQQYVEARQGHRGAVAGHRKTNTFAIFSIISGLLFAYGAGSALAIVFGFIALSQIKKSGGQGRQAAQIGIGIGFVGLGILVLLFIMELPIPRLA